MRIFLRVKSQYAAYEFKEREDAAVGKVEYVGGSGMEAEHVFYITVSKEKWEAGWRICMKYPICQMEENL